MLIPNDFKIYILTQHWYTARGKHHATAVLWNENEDALLNHARKNKIEVYRSAKAIATAQARRITHFRVDVVNPLTGE